MRLPVAAGAATGAVAVALYPLFQTGTWFWASLGAILVVTAVGMLASRYTLPVWPVPLAQLAVFWLYLTAVFAGDTAWARVVPTKESAVELAELVATGFADIQKFAVPVPERPGITLLTCGGVGLIAILVDFCAARLRRSALAGLPLLSLFVVPASFIGDPLSWPTVVIAALGFLGLLAADGRERVTHWGRAVLVRRTPSFVAPRPAAETGTLRLSGKRVGFAAIVLAVLLPSMVPTLEPNPLFGFGVGNGNGRGGNTIGIPNAMVNLRGALSLPANSTVLTYTSSDSASRYLRLYSLDVFDGTEWTMSPPRGRPQDRTSEGPLPPAPGQGAGVPAAQATTRVTVSEEVRRLSFLPLPYPATQVRIEGDWRADVDTLMVFSTTDTAEGGTYEVVSNEPRPTAEALRTAGAAPQAISDKYLRLPEDLPDEIVRLASAVTDPDAGKYEQAIQLQEFFTSKGGFSYTLATQGHGGPALTDFLIRSRAGYCEQFAASMAVLARVLGIPARVSVGYTGGTNISGQWTVRTHDSHAWPELYFEGTGWLRFEPTPAGAAGQGSATVPIYTQPEVTTGGDDTPTANPSTGPTGAGVPSGSASNPRNPMLDRDFGGVPVAVEEGTPTAVKIGLGGVAVLLVVLIPALLRAGVLLRRRRVYSRQALRSGAAGEAGEATATALGSTGIAAVRSNRGQATVAAAWAELDDALCDYGVSRQPSESPRALARRLSEQHEFDAAAAASLARIAEAVERMLFARTLGETGSFREDVRRVRRALASTVSRGRRVRAVLLPPSMLLRIRAMGTRLLDGFDRLENIRFGRPARRNA
ncbi:transglutaminaseTgpA domain-containing protein [Planomonospora venezuelensis]|uniref:Transglutaminase-like putative cysteine protease n=1 Tax=Planomonospora venezuelensis TaxID=1999 RepID=A0A841D927_PLAVE|nr:DUF3488 and transglutaminase-like domain-containing protein [Planomonospora venezuelensis]MBB5964828.1 transglutaminase-like putative cysteine protease [Planomonospora venezuelensis]GIM99315.1 transglutaminase [Planomonospora venezuelensis]